MTDQDYLDAIEKARQETRELVKLMEEARDLKERRRERLPRTEKDTPLDYSFDNKCRLGLVL